MSFIVRTGVAAAVLAMAVAIGYAIYQNIGSQEPAPDLDASPSSAAPAGMPDELRYVFIAATREVEGIDVEDRLVMDLSGGVFTIRTSQTDSVLTSNLTVPEAGVIRLETLFPNTGCEAGDVGLHRFQLSPGGSVLSIGLDSDDCAARAAAVEGEWRRSACRDSALWCLGPMEAGSQSALFFDPFRTEFGPAVSRHGSLTYTVPAGWANGDDRTHFYTLLRAADYIDTDPFDCLDCPDGLWIGAYPRVNLLACSDEPDETVGTSAQALADWVRAHPGLEVTDGPSISVDGRPTIVLDIAGSETYADACLDPEHGVTYVPLFSHPGYNFGIRTGDRHRLLLVEIDADTAMLIGVDSFDSADLDALIVETQPIIDSIRLTAP